MAHKSFQQLPQNSEVGPEVQQPVSTMQSTQEVSYYCTATTVMKPAGVNQATPTATYSSSLM